MQQDHEILSRCALFEGIDPQDRTGMLGCLNARVQEAVKQQVILSEGEPARYVGIVLSGTVQIERVDYYGNRSVMGQAGPGELFAESFACAGDGPMPANVVAQTAAKVLLIDCQRITASCCNACAFHSRLIYNLMRIMARKNLQLNQKIRITGKRTTREKLLSYLLEEAKLQGSDSFTIPYDRQALADYLQVERSAMSAELSKLRREGVLESKKNQFRLLRELESQKFGKKT